MPLPICRACATQFAEGEPPAECPVCADERQPLIEQRWTTIEELRERHRGDVREEEPDLLGIGMAPSFAIGQRALLVRSQGGNVLWDCIPLLEDDIVERVREAGGIDVIAVSHPHYYSSMVEWADTFDAPILLHAADREFVMRPDPRIEHWEGDSRSLWDGMTLVRLGGHFEGGTVLHWPAGAGGRGALLSGDVVQVVPDPGWVSFMYSYPNLIPLPGAEVERIAGALEAYPFDRIYGAWWERKIDRNGMAVVRRSAERYVQALGA